MQIVSIKDDKAYLLTYSAERENTHHVPTIEKIIDSFEIAVYDDYVLNVYL
jgi:hypothetical protein